MPNIDVVKIVIVVVLVVALVALGAMLAGAPWVQSARDSVAFLKAPPTDDVNAAATYSPWSLAFDMMQAIFPQRLFLSLIAGFLITVISGWFLVRYLIRLLVG